MRPKNNKNNKNNKNYIKEIIQKSGININNYFKKIKPDVKRLVLSFPNVKFNLIIKTIYSKPIATSKKIERHYNSGFIKLHAQNEFNEVYNSIIEKYKVWEEEHQGKESGLIFNEIENTEVKVVRVKSLNGSSYFDLGIKFNSLLNIQNNDNQCFAYSVIAGILYKLKENPDINKSFSDVFLRMNKNPARVSNYKPFLEMINMENIESPVSIDSIKTFEKQNENIAINVFGIENELLNVNIKNFNKSAQENNLRNIYPMYRSKLKEREYVIDLLYVTQNDSEDNHQLKKHFCLIKDFNAYLNHNHHKRYHCRNCITASYTTENALRKHIEDCFKKEPIKFKLYNNRIRYAYYNGKDLNLSEEEKEELYENYNNCYLCNIHLEKDEKIIEHNHLTGEIRGISCKSCNRKESRDGKQLPIFFHNGSGYDFHFITEELLKHETEYNKVKVLPKDTENYISITFGDRYFKLVFKDSMRFLLSSIDNLSKTLKDDQYKILKRELSDDGLFEDLQYHENNERSFKGIFPYDYFNSLEKLKDKSFPSKKEFYSILYQKDISEKEYEHGKKIFERYCKTFKDYLMLYQKLDVLILTDVFENFRDLCLKHYEIDPAYCYSAPGLSWNAGLKKTEIELELLHDKDMLDMFTDGIRGGFSGVLGQRFVKANNKYITNNSEEIKNPNYVVYTDANNLYACGMSDKLPYKNFNWEEHENQDIDYYLEKCNEEVGMVFKVDLESDLQTKYKLRKFPPMPISRVIDEEEISDYSRDFLKQHNNKLGKVKKLILDLHDKKEYIVHYDILQYYISLGIKVTKIHSIISFNHKAWLKDYIDFNTSMRAKATNDFEKDFWKLMNNSFYGKTMENISNRCIIELINKPEDLKRLASKDNFKDIIDFNNDFKAVQLNYKSMYFNKPIYLGMCILDYSKLVMYKFYYDVIEKYLPDNEIIFSDTDSMVLNIFTEDVYKDLEKIKDHLDTSNYPKDHFLYSTENKKVIGKFKDELSGNIITEFIAIRSKVYGYEYLENSSLKFKCVAKGVNKSTKKDFSSESYRDCLFNKKVINKTMFNLVHKKHKIYLNEMTKIGLSPFDDKRYICNNGIDTQPYGIESLYFT